MKITHNPIQGAMLNQGITSKFKTLRLQVTFHAPISEATVTKRAVLPYLMRAISKRYPTRMAMQTKLEEMYAASFGASVRKIGLTQEIAFDLLIIDPQYAIDTPNLLEEALQFLQDVIFQPNFDSAIFKEEIRLMDEYFMGLYSNKMRYTMQKLIASMYHEDPYRLDAMGQQEDLADLTLEDCQQAYQDMLENDVIHVNIVGDVDSLDIVSLVERFLPFESRMSNVRIIDTNHKPFIQPTHLVLPQDVEQGKLALGYRLPVYYLSDEYYQAVVFNALLGGGPDSILFKRIREELNKVYFIGSSYDQYKGSLFVYAGIDAVDAEVVMTEISALIEQIKQQTIKQETLHIAKTALIQNLVESMDSIGAITSRINHLALFHRTFDQEQLIQKIEQVTLTDVAAIAALISLDTTALLRRDINE